VLKRETNERKKRMGKREKKKEIFGRMQRRIWDLQKSRTMNAWASWEWNHTKTRDYEGIWEGSCIQR
jgi:hypothetical protein